jgi:hypothetical protein
VAGRRDDGEPDWLPYVAPPAEAAEPPRLARLGTALAVAVVLLLLAAALVTSLVTAREDPSLQIPGSATAPAGTDAPVVPTAPPPTLQR